ncbi:MAG: adenylate kinase [Candidatus Caldarchaeum sp.]|nr:adenylate kinase [Candidatus Caldarchaeum sp.]MDW8360421.1 adenylate kinase [Candidatus Caldarchaeum sp.]
MNVIVTALPGSGKTTTLKKLAEILPDVSVVNFGDIMFEEAANRYEVKHRDDMRKILGLHDYQLLQITAAQKIASFNKTVVVDTHSVIKSNSTYYPGLPDEVVKLIRPEAIVYMEFRPEDIVERRLKDAAAGVGRKREASDVAEVAFDQSVGRQFVVAAANAAMCYLKIISLNYPQAYPFQHAEDAAKQIAQTIERFVKKSS